MAKIQTSCKYCKSDIRILTEDKEGTKVGYYCILNKMENNKCPDDCEWFIPDKKIYVV